VPSRQPMVMCYNLWCCQCTKPHRLAKAVKGIIRPHRCKLRDHMVRCAHTHSTACADHDKAMHSRQFALRTYYSAFSRLMLFAELAAERLVHDSSQSAATHKRAATS
jgi:hypothetical protein